MGVCDVVVLEVLQLRVSTVAFRVQAYVLMWHAHALQVISLPFLCILPRLPAKDDYSPP